MTVYDSSMLELEAGDQVLDAERITEREEFNRIMDAAVGPALEMCRRMAELKKDGTMWDKEIFLVNCTSYLQVCLAFRAYWDNGALILYSQSTFHSFAFAASRVADMDRDLDQHVHVLVKEHVSWFEGTQLVYWVPLTLFYSALPYFVIAVFLVLSMQLLRNQLTYVLHEGSQRRFTLMLPLPDTSVPITFCVLA